MTEINVPRMSSSLKNSSSDPAHGFSLSPDHEKTGSKVAGTVRLLAFYLPQFHTIPQNDQWWGKGFTEWTNVSQARPLFPGHYQPHIPGELGFYDLRLPETRMAQAELAREHGIGGFCYWHYWFEGKRLLERPFQEVLDSGQPDFPFCLAWANETWSRRWLGEERDILQEQTYSFNDDARHAAWLCKAFTDPRYIRVNGRPLFLVYRPNHLPDPARTTEIFREECMKHGLGQLYLVGIDAHSPGFDYRSLGFDATLAFAPQLGFLPDFLEDGPKTSKLRRNMRRRIYSMKLKTYDSLGARRLMREFKRDHPYYPSVFVGWDNTSRRKENGIVIVDSGLDGFESDLRAAMGLVMNGHLDDRLVFLNAWNEWAEGNHLEPDLKTGRKLLEIVRQVSSEVTEITYSQ